MWTNVFKIADFHQLSWFQFLPIESDLNPLPDRSVKLETNDTASHAVLSAHLLLQKKGFISAWTNSFVGPWDPSQGLYNPDEKIKLWLFLPGRHSSIVENAQQATSRLRVVSSGIWLAPGDSEEVAAALSLALRNCIERALSELSYMRYGDVFTKHNPFHSEEIYRRGQPTVEFVFAATEEAIFVHVVVSAKYVRALTSEDLEKVVKTSCGDSAYKYPVIVPPNGMCGKLVGCSPSDVVKQVYFSGSSKSKAPNGAIGLPSHALQNHGCHLRGQSCYAEVTVGCPALQISRAAPTSVHTAQSLPKSHADIPTAGGVDKKNSQEMLAYEKTFIYPSETVIVPILQSSITRSSLKRLWLQNWLGPSLSGSSFFMHYAPLLESVEESNKFRGQNSNYSSSNSNSSSLSSLSSGSSGSDYKMSSRGDLEADADSLICRQPGSVDHLENDRLKMGGKRPRAGMTDLYGQGGADANEQMGSQWDWDDDDRGEVMDIQTLLSDFGDFGYFFESEALPFGEPPGTAESQTLMFSGSDMVVSGSPIGVIDNSDQMILPVVFPSFESFNPPPPVNEDSVSKDQDLPSTAPVDVPITQQSLNGDFDHIIKAEAALTFSQDYVAVETPTSVMCSSVFKTPYFPKSRVVDGANSSTNNYTYGPSPPSSPHCETSDDKTGASVTSKACHRGKGDPQSKSYYRLVEGTGVKAEKLVKSINSNTVAPMDIALSVSNVGSTSTKSTQREASESTLGPERLLFPMKTLFATEVECVMFQSFMCKIRYKLLSSSMAAPSGFSRVGGSIAFNHLSGCQSTDNISSIFEVKKKESLPVRIAGDYDGVLDGQPNAQVCVWRSVGVPKPPKPPTNPSIEAPLSSFGEEGGLSYGQRQPLQELLGGLQFLVQQATSFVDLTLDSECGDGPYGVLALEEQWRRGFSCGPSVVHAGCGGTLASCHSLDVAGLELLDPLSADVHVPTVFGLLQGDVKSALKAAFSKLEGPLSLTDWCKGRSQLGDIGTMGDGYSAESSVGECRDPSGMMTLSGGDPLSPSPSTSNLKEDSSQRRSSQDSFSESDMQLSTRLKPTLYLLPLPAILVGYQDDWLKTSASSLQIWEKAPLEPYGQSKPINYYVVCPDIHPLTSAAADFFQQLGTVYEACKLGTHVPLPVGNQMEVDTGKWFTSGFVLHDCPQSMKMDGSNASLVGSISDYFLSLSNGWDLTSYLKSLSKALKSLKLGPFSANQKEGTSTSSTVIYVVCPFPEPNAVLKTVVESSISLGSLVVPAEKRTLLFNQVGKALSSSAAVDEAAVTNVPVLTGFSVGKVVLQVVTVDAIFRVNSPALSELTILKETAFTVYNKARRISRGSSDVNSMSMSGRSQLLMSQMNSSISSMWKGEIDGGLRNAAWDNSWQMRSGGLSSDTGRLGDFFFQEEARFMFEPLFILAEPGSPCHGVSPSFSGTATESSKVQTDDGGGSFLLNSSSAGSLDSGFTSQTDASDSDSFASRHQKLPPVHCCYGWTEDWAWLVCIWTDARGELLDTHIYPFGGISSRQDTKGLQCLFAQVLLQGCQILQICSDNGLIKPRDFVVTRIGSFHELEYLEWQKAITEMKSWPLQLRRSAHGGLLASTNGASLQQDMIHDRALPSSPSTLYSPHSKPSNYMKGGLGQVAVRKQMVGGQVVDGPRGLLQWVQSISFVAVSVDHSLHLVTQADFSSPGGPQGGSGTGSSSFVEGFTPVKSLGSSSASFLLIPSPSMRFLPSNPLQLPTCLTAESPPLAHLLHSKGSALPLSTAFVVSKAAPTMRKDFRGNTKEEWPSILSIGLIDYYGGAIGSQEKLSRGVTKQQGGRSTSSDVKDIEVEAHIILESIAAELQALSWMTISPAFQDRRTALPFHCDMVLRLRRLLHFAEKDLSCQPETIRGA
ncbi:hypothetical protein MLD38_040314 [Melastoma candidum]|uniref:Uncharacterized protein n=1 Tax=Melastoma candidum TaxID=119954 RepID=A0ACB9L609_9MYRT|nr:hypothetical protein MLD38_040314 [Melastoma candidum]